MANAVGDFENEFVLAGFIQFRLRFLCVRAMEFDSAEQCLCVSSF